MDDVAHLFSRNAKVMKKANKVHSKECAEAKVWEYLAKCAMARGQFEVADARKAEAQKIRDKSTTGPCE